MVVKESTLKGGISDEAKKYFFETVFLGKPVVESLWIGLAANPSGTPTLKSLTAKEPIDAPGYERVQIQYSQFKLESDNLIASSPAVFKNAGPERWPGVDVGFIATSKDSTGVLLAWQNLRDMYELTRESTLSVPIRIHF